MSIAEQVARIKGEKSKIAIKLSNMGLAEQTADLETLADAIEGIDDKGAVNVTVRQGESYTIPKGYHNGSGIVTGLDNPEADAGKYLLQPKTITPTKSQQSATPDQGYYGLSSVTVNAIPKAYQDVTQVNATKKDVLAGKKIVESDGTVVVGEIPNYGNVHETLGFGEDGSNSWSQMYEIKKGYYEGGNIDISPDEPPIVTPTDTSQRIEAKPGKVIQWFLVEAIPDKFKDITVVTAPVSAVLSGFTFVNNEGKTVTGSMPHRGICTEEINPLTESSVSLQSGYYTSIDVTITDDLENELAAI